MTLSGTEAEDPANWVRCEADECHSVLAAIAEIVTRPRSSLAVDDQLELCRFTETRGPRPHRSSYVYGEAPVDGVFCPPLPLVQIDWTEDLRITSVRLRLAYAGPSEGDAIEPTRERLRAADEFVAWARGQGPAPDFAERVRVLYNGGGAPGSTGWVDMPEERTLYSGCSGLGFPDCGADPVAVIANYRGAVVPTAGRSTCADGGEVPRSLAEAESDVVRLEEPEPASCRRAWAVELWIDEDGEIYAVNQAGAPPTG